MRPSPSCAPRNATALGTLIAPLAIGRLRVRATLLSISRSHKSFTVHPAPRKSKEPTPNVASNPTSGNAPTGAANAMDQKHGHASSAVPIGRSNRISFAYGTMDDGSTFSTHVFDASGAGSSLAANPPRLLTALLSSSFDDADAANDRHVRAYALLLVFLSRPYDTLAPFVDVTRDAVLLGVARASDQPLACVPSP